MEITQIINGCRGWVRESSFLRFQLPYFSFVVALVAACPDPAYAVAYTLSASDASGTSSFNSAGNWSGGPPAPGAPSSGNTYYTDGFILRTPEIFNSTFGGDSLTINAGGVLALRNTTGGSITVNNVAANPGGLILDGGTVVSAGNLSTTINGVITVQADSILRPANTGRTQTIEAAIGGAGGLAIRSEVTPNGTVQYNSSSNTYGGETIVESGARLRMGNFNAMPHDASNGDLIVQTGALGDGVFELDGYDTTIQGLAGAGTVENANGTDANLIVQGDLGTPQGFSGTIQDGGSGGLSVVKTGATTQEFSGANGYTGGTNIEQGTLKASSNTALGTGAVVVSNNGGGAGTLELNGVTTANAVTLEGRLGTEAHILATGGAGQVNGVVTLAELGADDPRNFNLVSASGSTLNLSGGVGEGLAGTSTLNLGGEGGGTISGLAMAGGTDNLNKSGSGSWAVNGASISNAGQVHVQAGTLGLAGLATFGGNTNFLVDGGAFLDVSGVTGGDNYSGASSSFMLQSGQSIFGNGTVTGDVFTDAGSTVGPGASIGTLTFDGDLDLDGTLLIELTGAGLGSADMLNVLGSLDLTAAILDFVVLDALNDDEYIFATYTGRTGTFASVDTIAGYTLHYDYNGNQLALVRDAGPGPDPVPSPAPLALMAIGAFGLAGSRRWRRH